MFKIVMKKSYKFSCLTIKNNEHLFINMCLWHFNNIMFITLKDKNLYV